MSVDSTRGRRLGGFAALALVAFGCGEELGPEVMPTARVTGRVHVGGRPIGSGWVEFQPVDGTVGRLRSARLRPDGTFEADRVAVGDNVIRIADPPAEVGPGGVRAYSPVVQPFTRLPILRRTVGASGTTAIEIDLQAEYLRYLREGTSG